jgi:hypothetical protein
MSHPDDRLAPRPDDDRPRRPEDRPPHRHDDDDRPRHPDDGRQRYYDDDRGRPRREQKSNALMIVLIIVGVLVLLGGGAAALFWPALSKVRSAAARAQSQNNLKQIGIGVNSLGINYGKLPPAVGAFPNPQGPKGSSLYHLLPFMEQENVWAMYQRNPSGVPDSLTIKIFCAPSDPTNPEKGGKALTSYGANAAVFRMTDGGSTSFPGAFVKGTAYTVIFFERYAVTGGKRHPWYGINDRDNYLYAPGADGSPPLEGDFTPPEFDVDPDKADPNAPHAFAVGIINVGLGDSSVRSFTAKQMSPHAWAWGCSTFGPLPMEIAPPGW